MTTVLAHTDNPLEPSLEILLRQDSKACEGEPLHMYLRFGYPFPPPIFRALRDVSDGRAPSLRKEGAYLRKSCFEPVLIRILEIEAPRLDLFSVVALGLTLGCRDHGIVGGGAGHPVPVARPHRPMSGGGP